jgi:hypothetical protein
MPDHARRRINANHGRTALGHGTGEESFPTPEINDALALQVSRKAIEDRVTGEVVHRGASPHKCGIPVGDRIPGVSHRDLESTAAQPPPATELKADEARRIDRKTITSWQNTTPPRLIR